MGPSRTPNVVFEVLRMCPVPLPPCAAGAAQLAPSLSLSIGSSSTIRCGAAALGCLLRDLLFALVAFEVEGARTAFADCTGCALPMLLPVIAVLTLQFCMCIQSSRTTMSGNAHFKPQPQQCA